VLIYREGELLLFIGNEYSLEYFLPIMEVIMDNNNQHIQVEQVRNYGSANVTEKYLPVSFGDWMLTFLLVMIPIAGFVLLFVWAFSTETNPSKANWAKATLVWMAIMTVFYILFFAIIAAIVGGSLSELKSL